MTDARSALVDGRPIARLEGAAVAIAPCSDGLHGLVLTRFEDNQHALWRCRFEDGAITSLARFAFAGKVILAPDGARAFAYEETPYAVQWRDAAGGEGAIGPHGNRVLRCVCTSDGALLAIVCDRYFHPHDGAWVVPLARVVNVADGRALLECDCNAVIAFTDDGRALVTVDIARTSLVVRSLGGSVRTVALGSVVEPREIVAERGGTRVALVAMPCEVFVCDVATGRLVTHFWADDRASVAGFGGGKLVTLERQRGGVVRRVVRDIDAGTETTLVGDGRAAGPVTRDGAWMLWHSPPLVSLVSTSDGRATSLHDGHETPVIAMAWSWDGAALATLSTSCAVRVLDVSSGALAWTFESSSRGVSTLAFSPDGRSLLAAGRVEHITWDLTTGEERSRDSHEGLDPYGPRWLVFSPDGQSFLSNVTGKLCLWSEGAAPRELSFSNAADVAFDGPERVRIVGATWQSLVMYVEVSWRDLAGRLVAQSRRPNERWASLVAVTDRSYDAVAIIDGSVVRADLRDEASFTAICQSAPYRRIVAARGRAALVEKTDGAFALLDVDDGRERAVIRVSRGVTAWSMAPGGLRVAAAYRDGGVEVFEAG